MLKLVMDSFSVVCLARETNYCTNTHLESIMLDIQTFTHLCKNSSVTRRVAHSELVCSGTKLPRVFVVLSRAVWRSSMLCSSCESRLSSSRKVFPSLLGDAPREAPLVDMVCFLCLIISSTISCSSCKPRIRMKARYYLPAA